MITRRNFLAGSILAIPGASILGGLIRSMPIKHSEFAISCHGWDRTIFITTFANGSFNGRYCGRPLQIRQSPGRYNDRYKILFAKGCEIRLKFLTPDTILVDWIRMWEMRDGSDANFFDIASGKLDGACVFDDFLHGPNFDTTLKLTSQC